MPQKMKQLARKKRCTEQSDGYSVDWRPVINFFERNKPLVRRAYCQAHEILQWCMWKHHFRPIDTSHTSEWLKVPPNFIPPLKPIINRMPCEILSMIFTFVVHGDSTTPKDRYTYEIQRKISSGSSPTTPLTLSQVSRFWRSFVHNSPILWSTLVVCAPAPRDVEYTAFWLSKSGTVPLNLTLEQYISPDRASDAIAQLFVTEAHRWKRISFGLSVQSSFSNLRPHDVPLLEEFRLRITHWGPGPHPITQFIDALHSSPNLKTINWGKSLGSHIPTNTPWAQLVNLTLYRLDISELLLDALPQCTSLKVLQLRRIRAAEYQAQQPIILHRLESLVCERPERFSGIFDCLTLPCLSDVEMTDTPFYENDARSLNDLVGRSGCRLTTLTLNSLANDGLMAVLSHAALQSVSSLTIMTCIKKDQVLVSLTKSPQGRYHLPNLRHITLDGLKTSDGLLAAMAWSRRHELLTLQVCIDGRQSPKDHMTLGWMREHDVSVRIYEPVSQMRVFSLLGGSLFSSDSVADLGDDVVPVIRFPDHETLWS
ncbi:hypothetical protein M413DRAFT_168063 [Hebeloma cylindrosporum]|uniref:Uncharacterized protein n=1 Tax=Hebeloma cylindrosporum TaxID=76867 RepID=A0A0C3BVZ4_HEBCY|nr:hypothetical protein M413DRAFT_168063 [Hebeloma cylindrosporum h7]